MCIYYSRAWRGGLLTINKVIVSYEGTEFTRTSFTPRGLKGPIGFQEFRAAFKKGVQENLGEVQGHFKELQGNFREFQEVLRLPGNHEVVLSEALQRLELLFCIRAYFF